MRSLEKNSVSVLIIEDDEFTATLLKFMLEREQYEVFLVQDGKAALHYIENNAPPSIVLMDVMLPYISGFELLHRLHQQEGWEQTHVVMLSAKGSGVDIAHALSHGAADYLVKPFNPDELMARLQRYLPKSKNPS